ncbi:unnamed protein product [Protopolystoma xenopodis]|uniref:Uncharacterized protein n=1 Tax=Protopolystoma xenopodis TaxID=117903 RepID=A0A3S5B3E0_9PLAT|nr:unnamed protein product [Protopolystoma xenopodis]
MTSFLLDELPAWWRQAPPILPTQLSTGSTTGTWESEMNSTLKHAKFKESHQPQLRPPAPVTDCVEGSVVKEDAIDDSTKHRKDQFGLAQKQRPQTKQSKAKRRRHFPSEVANGNESSGLSGRQEPAKSANSAKPDLEAGSQFTSKPRKERRSGNTEPRDERRITSPLEVLFHISNAKACISRLQVSGSRFAMDLDTQNGTTSLSPHVEFELPSSPTCIKTKITYYSQNNEFELRP